MSYEIVVKNTKKIEAILNNMNAEGSGLYEKSLSIQNKLDKKTLNSIRFVSTVRNKLLHEDGFEFSSKLLEDFLIQCQSIENTLSKDNMKKSQNYCQVTNESIKNRPYKRGVLLPKKEPAINKTEKSNSLNNMYLVLTTFIISVMLYNLIK